RVTRTGRFARAILSIVGNGPDLGCARCTLGPAPKRGRRALCCSHPHVGRSIRSPTLCDRYRTTRDLRKSPLFSRAGRRPVIYWPGDFRRSLDRVVLSSTAAIGLLEGIFSDRVFVSRNSVPVN